MQTATAAFLIVPLLCTFAAAQAPQQVNPNLALLTESGSITWHHGSATLEASGSHAVRQVAQTLQICLDLPVSSEEPFQMFLGDLLDTAAPQWAATHPDPASHPFAPRPARVHLDFATDPTGRPASTRDLLHAVAGQLNMQQPDQFELERVQRPRLSFYALVAHTTHDESGRLIAPRPYLDTPITLQKQSTTVIDIANQLTAQLSQVTGHHFFCCQGSLFGTPWGLTQITYAAANKPAREVLADLMNAEPRFSAYTSTCEAHSHDFCVIELHAIAPSPHRSGTCTLR